MVAGPPTRESRSVSGLPTSVVLLSGGLDSTTVLGIAQNRGFKIAAISFSYGQRNHEELKAAKNLAISAQVDSHVIVDLDLRIYGGSALTDNIDVPKNRHIPAKEIPVTYVPARNTIFLSHALALAEVVGAQDILIGVNALDYSGYPDCRPEYIKAFENMANLATRVGVEQTGAIRIQAPLIDLSKAEIIQRGMELGIDYGVTMSCYDPPAGAKFLHCGECDACQLRKKGFAEAKVSDPTRYLL